jgi:3-oxocholest-4-en-26-oate---CoA ligase
MEGMRGMGGTFNLARVFGVIADALGDQDCIVAGPRRRSYVEIADGATRIASYLNGRGLGVHAEREELAGHQSGQDHLALALYNRSEYLEGMIRTYGARVAPFNVNYPMWARSCVTF